MFNYVDRSHFVAQMRRFHSCLICAVALLACGDSPIALSRVGTDPFSKAQVAAHRPELLAIKGKVFPLALDSSSWPTPTEFFNWVEHQFPRFFPGPQIDRNNGSTVFRHYPASNTYLGVADGRVYYIGAATNGQLASIGHLADFACAVKPSNCSPGSDPGYIDNTPPACDSQAITCVELASRSTEAQAYVPVTFGQPFRAGDLPAGQTLSARDSAGNVVPIQIDEKSTYADGSVRFAVVSLGVGALQARERRIVNLYQGSPAAADPIAPNASTFDLQLTATIYSAQLTVVSFGNHSGTIPGIPFVAGESITMRIRTGNSVESFRHIVTPEQEGGGFQTLTKIAETFMQAVNTQGHLYRAYKIGGGGGYEKFWITSKALDQGPFALDFEYAGKAIVSQKKLNTFRPPRVWIADGTDAVRRALLDRKAARLSGPVAHEQVVSVPFRSAGVNGVHPQLTARLYARFLQPGNLIRTDIAIENNWAYNPEPGNLTYELVARQNGQVVLQAPAFQHNHHARWHRLVWHGDTPKIRVRHNMPYVLSSRATLNYDLGLKVPQSVLLDEAVRLAETDTRPMGPGMITTYFPTTGGRSEIGPLPRWAALYLVTQDDRALASMLANADAAGSVPIHYRDALTDQPLDLERHPGVALRIGASSKADVLPAVVDGATIWSPDISHQASFAYVPYLITGDAYYLDEMMFWASWNMGAINPTYRGFGIGLIHAEQLRGQAWALRSIGDAARLAPDLHPLKGYFRERLNNNLMWYVNNYVRSPAAGAISPMAIIEWSNIGSGQAAPWQHDLMALVMGHLAESGESLADEFHRWLSQFTVGRFLNEEAGFCRAKAPGYYIKIRDAVGTFANTWTSLYNLNWPGVLCEGHLSVDGTPSSASGYAAYARAMLANAADRNIPGAAQAYREWQSMTPNMDKAFPNDPTWAIVPRISTP